MSLPVVVNLTLYRGDDAPFVATLTDAAGDPLDLTGCALALTLREKHGQAWDGNPAVVALAWPTGSGIVVSDPATGVAAITIPASATALLSPYARYRWDVQVTDASGAVTTVVCGDATVTADVSES